jgi:hypothetical protein
MTRRRSLVAVALMVTSLLVGTSPWLIYWFALSQIEGRPTKATQTVTPEQTDVALRKLRTSQPVQVDPMSPYTVLRFDRPSSNNVVASWIAHSYAVSQFQHTRILYWHFAHAALTIWLTRNWTPSELVAKAVELDSGNRDFRAE